jgi:hypothetical protein
MRSLILLALLSVSAFAHENSYQFDTFNKADDYNFTQIVTKKEWSLVVFGGRYCPVNDTRFDCYPFESKLETISPQVHAMNKSIQIVNIDVTRNYVQRRYAFKRFPAVVLLLNGREMQRIDQYKGANDLIYKTYNMLLKISN